MSYDSHDARMEEFYDRISEKLYPEHKDQAIEEFTEEMRKRYYKQNPRVMRPAVEAFHEGNWQLENKRYSSALVFYVSAIELFFKTTLLRPMLNGLIHNEDLAEIMVETFLRQTGAERYEKLLVQLFDNFSKMKLKQISREGAQNKLFVECHELQSIRNDIIHKGTSCAEVEAEKAHQVSEAVFEKIVKPLLLSIGLYVEDEGEIVEH